MKLAIGQVLKKYFQGKSLPKDAKDKILQNMYMAQANGGNLAKLGLGLLGAGVIALGVYLFSTPQGQEKLVYYAPAQLQVEYVQNQVKDLEEVDKATSEVEELDRELAEVEAALQEVDKLLK